MSSISCARNSYVDIDARRILLDEPMVSSAGVRKAVQLFAVALTAVTLAACAQSSVVTNKSELFAASRQASLEHNRKASIVTNRRMAVVTKKHTPFATISITKSWPMAACLPMAGQRKPILRFSLRLAVRLDGVKEIPQAGLGRRACLSGR
jgi:hypothetical protein